MIYAFFESFKYVGHLFPVAFLRVYLGYYWVNVAASMYNGGAFSTQSYVNELKTQFANHVVPEWYKMFLDNVIFQNWHLFSNLIVGAQFLVGISLAIGFLVRPMCLLGIIVSIHFVYLGGGPQESQYMSFIAIFITLLWLGAGRCLGFDYFFYKRNRGIWW
jgi:thiosulfate dehydrogenase [quinone] large subunit